MKNIIAISGKEGSGKDTVAKIVRTFFSEDSDKKRILNSGDSELIHEYLQSDQASHLNCDWTIRRFAEPLKRMIAALLQVPESQLEQRDFKESILPSLFDSHLVSFGLVQLAFVNHVQAMRFQKVLVNSLKSDKKPRYEHRRNSVRDLIIHLSDVMKKHVNPSMFTELFFKQCKDSNVIIADLRLRIELEKIQKVDEDALIIRVQRGEQKKSEKVIENDLDYYTFENIIDNDGDLVKLVKSVHDILVNSTKILIS